MEMKYVILAIAVLMYALVIAFQNKKQWITLGAAALVMLLGAVSPIQAVGEFINWNVLLIYVGSLIIAELFIYSKVPAVLADTIVEKSPTLGVGIVALLVLTGLISAFVENVATVLVMAPIAIELCKKLKISMVPFMIGLAVMANLQGTATLVGDPPSMIFAAYAKYGFNDFFFYNGKMSIFFAVQVGALVGAVYMWFFFRKLGKIPIDMSDDKIKSWVPTILLLALIFGLAAISFLFHGFNITSGAWCFFLGILGILWYVLVMKETKTAAWDLVKGLDWDTILFLIGIFVVIGGISNSGLLKDLADALGAIIGNNALLGFVVIVAFSVLISGFVDNVPYIIVMLPVAGMLATTLNLPREVFMFGLLVGSCMGGNLTPFGASANVVALGLVKKNGEKATFGEWMKVAGPFTVFTTAAASVFVWVVWG